jgi:probable rRNA maturation factor
MATITYLGDKKCLKNIQKKNLKQTITRLCADHHSKLTQLTYVFINDEELLEMNKQFLQHDYYTDIITFDLSENKATIDGELYISTDRVLDNSHMDASFEIALLRVILHGVLHLCGLQDKSPKDKEKMRQKETHYITLYLESLGNKTSVSRETK